MESPNEDELRKKSAIWIENLNDAINIGPDVKSLETLSRFCLNLESEKVIMAAPRLYQADELVVSMIRELSQERCPVETWLTVVMKALALLLRCPENRITAFDIEAPQLLLEMMKKRPSDRTVQYEGTLTI